jgi:hypothetical protein
MIMECSYAVTAWTEAVEDEHRLLSQVLAVLFAYPELPADAMTARLAGLAERHPIEGRIAQTKADGKADFWNAVGGQYKASLDYVVTIACESGSAVQRGPQVSTQTLGIRPTDGPASAVTELHRLAGSVLGGDGRPQADAWVALPELGLLTSSRADGRFVFDRIPSGTQRVVARSREGGEAEQQVTVPGGRAVLAIDSVKGTSAKIDLTGNGACPNGSGRRVRRPKGFGACPQARHESSSATSSRSSGSAWRPCWGRRGSTWSGRSTARRTWSGWPAACIPTRSSSR